MDWEYVAGVLFILFWCFIVCFITYFAGMYSCVKARTKIIDSNNDDIRIFKKEYVVLSGKDIFWLLFKATPWIAILGILVGEKKHEWGVLAVVILFFAYYWGISNCVEMPKDEIEKFNRLGNRSHRGCDM